MRHDFRNKQLDAQSVHEGYNVWVVQSPLAAALHGFSRHGIKRVCETLSRDVSHLWHSLRTGCRGPLRDEGLFASVRGVVEAVDLSKIVEKAG